MSRDTCPVCGIMWGRGEPCESPACPVVGMRMGSDEAEGAALRWRSRPSVASARSFAGDDALAVLERDTWLEYEKAVDALQFGHEEMPA